MSSSPVASYSHVFRHSAELPAEGMILAEVTPEGGRVLDVGTGATGRTARLANQLPADVVSIEINQAALTEFAASGDRADIGLAAADLERLPFAASSFDVVLIAFHGFDYLLEPAQRRRALADVARVLRPGGTLVVNSWNRLGIVFSPNGLRSPAALRLRGRYLLRGDVARSSLVDGNGLRLHQSTVGGLRSEIERATNLSLRYVTNSHGTTRSYRRVALTSPEPYFVFA